MFNICCSYSYKSLQIPLVSLCLLSWLWSPFVIHLWESVSFSCNSLLFCWRTTGVLVRCGDGQCSIIFQLSLSLLVSLCLRTETSQVFLQLYNSHPYCSLPFPFPLYFLLNPWSLLFMFFLCWNWKFRDSSSGRNPLPQAPIMLWQGPFPKSKLCYGRRLWAQFTVLLPPQSPTSHKTAGKHAQIFM